MPNSLLRWFRSKWLLLFAITVLVLPELLSNSPGPANDGKRSVKRRRIVAECTQCGFKTDAEVCKFVKL